MLYGAYHQAGAFIARFCVASIGLYLRGARALAYTRRVLGGPVSGIIVTYRHGEKRAMSDDPPARTIRTVLSVKETMWAHGILALQWHASKIRACCVAAGIS
jgi:hypothetical protein